MRDGRDGRVGPRSRHTRIRTWAATSTADVDGGCPFVMESGGVLSGLIRVAKPAGSASGAVPAAKARSPWANAWCRASRYFARKTQESASTGRTRPGPGAPGDCRVPDRPAGRASGDVIKDVYETLRRYTRLKTAVNLHACGRNSLMRRCLPDACSASPACASPPARRRPPRRQTSETPTGSLAR